MLVNANAGRVTRHRRLLEGLRDLVPDDRLAVTHSAEEIQPALEKLRATGIEDVAIVGGDGTVTESLTALPGRQAVATTASPTATATDLDSG